jgi:hypothetical protein
MSSVKVGDTNAGYRVIAVKKGTIENLSIVLAENVSDPAKYVVWAFDGLRFKNGIYRSDREKAQQAYNSRNDY